MKKRLFAGFAALCMAASLASAAFAETATPETARAETPQAVQYDASEDAAGFAVSAAADPGVLPDGAQLAVSLLDDSAEDTPDPLPDYGERAAALDLTFYKEDAAVEPDGTVKVNIQLPEALAADLQAVESPTVVHRVQQDDGTTTPEVVAEADAFSADRTQVSFETDSFSVYEIYGVVPEDAVKDEQVDTQANRSYTIAPGNSVNVSVSSLSGIISSSCKKANGESETGIKAVQNGNTGYTIEVGADVSAGVYTLTVNYSYRVNKGTRNATDTVTLTVDDTPAGKVAVHVYVSSSDSNGNSWKDNQEFQDLIGLYVCDNNGYFPAGTIYLDESYFNNKANADREGVGLINSASDWQTLLGLLSDMKNTNLNGSLGAQWASNNKSLDFSNNNGNKVSEYLSQAKESYNAGWGSKQTALFRWHKTFDVNSDRDSHLGHYGDTITKYHLDLCFNINTIKFICGNNSITPDISPDACDGKEVDSRAYITGSLIQNPRNLKVPAGYQLVGYYSDYDLKTPWNGIGTPLNEDQTVYIKIAPLDNVILHYVVAEGQGTVAPDNEALNPETGVAKGSTATPADGWRFDGWYADEACTIKVGDDPNFVPTKPGDCWVSATYYAKFVPATTEVTVRKYVTGALGDKGKDFNFTLNVTDADGNAVNNIQSDKYSNEEISSDFPFTLKDGETITFYKIPVGATVTVTEADYGEGKGGYTTYYKVDNAETKTQGNTATVIATSGNTIEFTNNKDVNPDMGITLHSMPYLMVLAGVLVGGTAWVRRRKRS